MNDSNSTEEKRSGCVRYKAPLSGIAFVGVYRVDATVDFYDGENNAA